MYKRGAKGWPKHTDFIILDVLSLLVSFCIAHVLRYGGQEPLSDYYQGYLLVALVFDVAVCILFSSMHNVLKRGYYLEFAATLKHAGLVFVMMMVLLVALKTSARYSRLVMYGTPCLHVLLGYGMRVGYKLFRRKRMWGERRRSVLVVADEASAAQIVHNLQRRASGFLQVTGVVLSNRDACGEAYGSVPVVADMDGAARYICREWIDEVFMDALTADQADKLKAQCREMGVVVHECLHQEQSEPQHQFVEKIGGYTVLTSSVNSATVGEAFVKRTMDIIGGLVGCLLAVVIIAIVGPRIKKASPGPILYAQERIGENGRRFKLYKLRSMHMDADDRKQELMQQNRMADGMMFKLDFDPRVIGNEILPDGTRKTGVGAFIRRTSLDEFPQFFNVLKGDMSLVGTRPPTVDEWERYALHHRARLAMKPGITGLWQVSGRSTITDFEEIVRLDTHYICTWNIGLDIKILLKTVLAVFRRDGAM